MQQKRTKSKIVIGILILALVGSGIGTTFFAGRSSKVASVGGKDIQLSDFMTFYRQRVNYIEGITGQKLSEDALLNIKKNLIAEMVEDAMISSLTEELGIKIGLETTRKYIRKIDAFLDESGNFSKKKFKQILSFIGVTEVQHAEKVRDYIGRMLLLESLLGSYETDYALPFNDKAINAIYTRAYQKRTADILEITKDFPKPKLEPISEKEISDFYQSNTSLFFTKARRSFSYAVINLNKFSDGATVDEVELNKIVTEKSNDSQADIFNILFTSKKDADDAYTLISSNQKTFEDIAKDKFGNSFTQHIEIKDVSMDSTFPETILNEVFKLEPGKTSNVISSSMGWHIIKVNSFHKPSQDFLAQFRENSKRALLEKKKAQLLQEMVRKMNDDLAGGQELSFIAEKYGIELKDVSMVDDQSIDQNGNNLGIDSQTVSTAFNQEVGKTESFAFNPSLNGYVSIFVKDLQEPKQKSLEESRPEVNTALKKKQIDNYLLSEAKNLVVRYQSGENVERFYGVKVLKKQDIYKVSIAKQERLNQSSYPEALVEQLFKMTDRGVTDPLLWDGGAVIATLTGVQNPSSVDPSRMKNMKKAFADANVQILRQQFVSSLESDYKAKINTDLFEKHID